MKFITYMTVDEFYKEYDNDSTKRNETLKKIIDNKKQRAFEIWLNKLYPRGTTTSAINYWLGYHSSVILEDLGIKNDESEEN